MWIEVLSIHSRLPLLGSSVKDDVQELVLSECLSMVEWRHQHDLIVVGTKVLHVDANLHVIRLRTLMS